MKRLIGILAAVMVIAVSGGAVWFFFLQAETPVGEGEEAKQAAAEAQVELLEFETIVVPIIHDRQIKKFVMVQFSLEMVNAEAKENAERRMPRLQDALFRTVYGYFSNQPAGRPAINIGQVKSRMQRASDKVLGPNQVKGVVIRSALERRKF